VKFFRHHQQGDPGGEQKQRHLPDGYEAEHIQASGGPAQDLVRSIWIREELNGDHGRGSNQVHRDARQEQGSGQNGASSAG